MMNSQQHNMRPTANIAQITWLKVFLSTTLLYTLHWGSTTIYSNHCASGWMGAAMVTAPHCSMAFNIMTWSRQWYMAICWIMVAKIVQDVSFGVEWLIYKGDTTITKETRKQAQLWTGAQAEKEMPVAEFQPGSLYQSVDDVSKSHARHSLRRSARQRNQTKPNYVDSATRGGSGAD